MKTIIETATKVSIHLLADDVDEDLQNTLISQMGVDATVISDVSFPTGNYYANKYKYIDGAWVLDDTFSSPYTGSDV